MIFWLTGVMKLRFRVTIVATETIYTLIAQLSCDQVCSDFQWLLYV